MKPTVGRIVNYVLPQDHKWAGQVRPAVITMVWGDTCVNLHVLHDANDVGDAAHLFLPTSVSFDERGIGRTWSWPKREE